MFCPECGEPKQVGNFCRKCGFSLKSDIPKKTKAASADQENEYSQKSVLNLPTQQFFSSPRTPANPNFAEAIGICFRKFAVFQGRATRSEYWYWVLLQVAVFIFSIFLELAMGNSAVGNLISGLFFFGTLLPSLAVLVRRLHDTGKSGWWILIQAVPIIGSLIIIVFTLQYSEDFDNEFGQAPI